MAKLTCAIIGLGKVAGYQLKAISQINKYELIGVCDVNKDKLKGFKIPTYSDLSSLLNCSKPDVLIISVPLKEHYNIALEALKSGCHVLLEKPPTNTLLEFDKLCEISHSKEKLFYSSYHFVFSRELQWFLNEFYPSRKEYLGPVTGFTVQFYDPYISDYELLADKENLGGSWLDSGINAISILLQFIPEIHFKYSSFQNCDRYNCKEVSSKVEFEFNTSNTGTVHTDWHLGLRVKKSEIYFSKNKTKIMFDHNNQTVIQDDGKNQKLLIEFKDQISRQIARYIGVFNDLFINVIKKKDNRIFSRRCLELMLEANQACIKS